MSETWAPEDPTLLPQHLSIPRSASALWWPSLRVLRVSSRMMDRPSSMRALETLLHARGVDPETCEWLCADQPYLVPPLVAAWSRTASARAGSNGVKVWWALSLYRPVARLNDKQWTWRKAWVDRYRAARVFQPDDLPRIDAKMETTVRDWARMDGYAYLPEVETGTRVTEAHLEAARAARALRGAA